MEILWLNHRDMKHPEAGGAEVRIREIGRRLVKKGCNITLMAERWTGSEKFEVIDGIQIIRVGGRQSVHLNAPCLLKKMEDNYEVVIDDMAHALPWFSPFFTKKPVIGQVHHVHQNVLKLELPRYSEWVVGLAEKSIRCLYKNVIAVSESTKKALVEELRVPSERIKVVLNGVDHKIYKPSQKGIDPTILWVGRVKKYKRLEHLLLAFREVKKRVPDAKLIIVGDGDYLGEVERFAMSLSLSGIVFTGKLIEEEKVQLMGSSWMMVSTSIVEGWGMTIIEGASCATPAVAYDVPGLRDSVRNGETGLLAEAGSVEDLVNKIITIFKNDTLRERLSRSALNYSRQFNWDRTAETFLKVIRRAHK